MPPTQKSTTAPSATIANGNLLTAANNAGSYTMAYDALDRTTDVSEPFGVSLAFGYDANDNRTSVTDSFGGVTTSQYDGLDRLTRREMTGTQHHPGAGRLWLQLHRRRHDNHPFGSTQWELDRGRDHDQGL